MLTGCLLGARGKDFNTLLQEYKSSNSEVRGHYQNLLTGEKSAWEKVHTKTGCNSNTKSTGKELKKYLRQDSGTVGFACFNL